MANPNDEPAPTRALTEEEIQARKARMMEEAERLRADPTTPRTAYWLSFADPEKGNLGAAIVDDVVNFIDAITESHRRGCNPGGEVNAWELPVDGIPPHFPRNTLLTRAEWEKLDE